MRKIKNMKWKSDIPKYNDKKEIIGKEEVEEDLLKVLNVLIAMKKPEDMPRGLDKFRLFNRLTKAFEKADETDELVLEEVDYLFLKKAVESDIPSTWGMNKKISEAIESFLEAPFLDPNTGKVKEVKLENGNDD